MVVFKPSMSKPGKIVHEQVKYPQLEKDFIYMHKWTKQLLLGLESYKYLYLCRQFLQNFIV